MPLGILKRFLVALFLGGFIVLGVGASCATKSTSSTSAPVSTSQISIKNLAFDPANATVSVGTTVTWVNNDTVVHQIESDGNLPDLLSGELQPGESYSFSFSQAGNYAYHCKIHPTMTGQITVE